MSGIGIITNPHSKLNKRNPERPVLLGYILGEQGRLEVTQSLADLARVAERFRDNHVEILAINGGDGTISRTLTAFIHAYGDKPLPKVALLRGGTMNVLASNLKIKGSPEQILFRLVEQYSIGAELSSTTIRTLDVQGNHGFLFADGLACSVLEHYYQNKSNALGAMLLVTRLFFSALFKKELASRLLSSRATKFRPYPLDMIEHDSCTIMAATIEKMPLGPKLFPLAGRSRDEFQFFSVTSQPQQLPWHLPSILTSRREGTSLGKVSHCCQELAIFLDRRYTYTLDGELFETDESELRLKLGPDIEFVLP